jgi:hypothetical protein
MRRIAKAMKTSEGWRGRTGGCLTVSCLVVLLAGCDAPGAVRAYLGGHERQAIQPEPQASASAAALPSGVVASAPAASSAAPDARVAAPEQDSVGAPTQIPRPYDSATPPVRARSGLAPTVGVTPTFPAPSHAGLSTPLNPVPGGVELGAPLRAPSAPAVAPRASTGTRNVSIGGASVSGGNVSNAARVIAGARAPLRACYAREASPASGSMRFALSVGPTGAPTVAVTKSAELSSQLLSCATAAAKALRFEVPESGTATIQFPATFVSDVPAKGGPVPSPTLPFVPKGNTAL